MQRRAMQFTENAHISRLLNSGQTNLHIETQFMCASSQTQIHVSLFSLILRAEKLTNMMILIHRFVGFPNCVVGTVPKLGRESKCEREREDV